MFRVSANFLLLHFLVFIWGFTGILGKLITLPASSLVWYRMLIAAAGVLVFIKLKKRSLKAGVPLLLQLLFIGALVALHWILFFEAIKVSNVSVALACISSVTLFTALLEPLFYRRRLSLHEFLSGFIIIAGILMIFKFETDYVWGIIYSLASAFLSALFTVLNGQLVKKNDPVFISFYELLGGWLCISVYFGTGTVFNESFFSISGWDWFYLLILGLVCTAFAYVAGVSIMKEIKPYTVMLTVNLEPVYSIVFAYLIFGESEKMTLGFYGGALLIIATIYVNAFLRRKARTGLLTEENKG